MKTQRIALAVLAALVGQGVFAGEIAPGPSASGWNVQPSEKTFIFGGLTTRVTYLGPSFVPTDVANGGAAVTGRNSNPPTSTAEGWQWRRGEVRQPPHYGDASGVSWDGKVIVGSEQKAPGDYPSQAYRNDQGKGVAYFDPGRFDHSSDFYGTAWDPIVSGNGKVVAGWDSEKGLYTWNEGQAPTPLPKPTNETIKPIAASFDGSVIAGNVYNNLGKPVQTVLWTKTADGYAVQDLPMTRIVGVTADGKAVVGADAAGNAIRWQSETGAVPLGVQVGPNASMSADGRRIVSNEAFTHNTRNLPTMIWDADFGEKPLLDYLTKDLGVDVKTIEDAFGFLGRDGDMDDPNSIFFDLAGGVISPDGLTFAGWGNNNWSLGEEGFMISLSTGGSSVPEPSTLSIASLIACCILFRRR